MHKNYHKVRQWTPKPRLAIWVKSRRKALGLTQKELAHQLGCSLSVVQKIEIDERRPSREIAELLAHHLELDVEERAAVCRPCTQAASA